MANKATAKQIELLKELGIDPPKYWTRGNCHSALNYLLTPEGERCYDRIAKLKECLEDFIGVTVIYYYDKSGGTYCVLRVFVKSRRELLGEIRDNEFDRTECPKDSTIPATRHPFRASIRPITGSCTARCVSMGSLRRYDGETNTQVNCSTTDSDH